MRLTRIKIRRSEYPEILQARQLRRTLEALELGMSPTSAAKAAARVPVASGGPGVRGEVGRRSRRRRNRSSRGRGVSAGG